MPTIMSKLWENAPKQLSRLKCFMNTWIDFPHFYAWTECSTFGSVCISITFFVAGNTAWFNTITQSFGRSSPLALVRWTFSGSHRSISSIIYQVTHWRQQLELEYKMEYKFMNIFSMIDVAYFIVEWDLNV